MRIVVQGDRVWVCGRGGGRHSVKLQAPKFQLAVQSLTAHVFISNTCPEKHLCAGAQMHSHVLFACTTNGEWERIWASSVCAVFFGAHFLSKWYFSFVICSNQCHCAPLPSVAMNDCPTLPSPKEPLQENTECIHHLQLFISFLCVPFKALLYFKMKEHVRNWRREGGGGEHRT